MNAHTAKLIRHFSKAHRIDYAACMRAYRKGTSIERAAYKEEMERYNATHPLPKEDDLAVSKPLQQ